MLDQTARKALRSKPSFCAISHSVLAQNSYLHQWLQGVRIDVAFSLGGDCHSKPIVKYLRVLMGVRIMACLYLTRASARVTGIYFLAGLALPTLLYSAQAEDGGPVTFADGFDISGIADLFPSDRSRWTSLQKTFPQNEIDLVNQPLKDGSASLRLRAVPSISGSNVSKAGIVKKIPQVRSGQHFHASAWFLIPPSQDLNNLYIMDIECSTCWPVNAHVPNPSPGVRIRLKDADGEPVLERGKIKLRGPRNELNTGIPLPRGQWFKLDWHLDLSSDDTGLTEIMIDDKIAFRGRGANLLNPSSFEGSGIKLERVQYDRFQIGITANGVSNTIEMFVDDVSIRVQ
jgi:hypothetical protein